MEACLGEELPAPTELEEALRNGVILAKLGHRFAPRAVALKKIYDPDQIRYQVPHTRHFLLYLFTSCFCFCLLQRSIDDDDLLRCSKEITSFIFRLNFQLIICTNTVRNQSVNNQ